MKRVLLLVLPILIIIAVGLTVLDFVQVRSAREKLMDDLMRKARTVAESTGFSARGILKNNNLKEANRLVESFQPREHVRNNFLLTRHLRDYMLVFLSLYHPEDIVYL